MKQTKNKKQIKLNKSGFVDLHIHSSFSDGVFLPEEITVKAYKYGLKAFSIADHDNIDGIKEIHKVKILQNLKFISGVEISVSPPNIFKSLGNFHILGYGIDIKNSDLITYLKKIQKTRKERSRKILDLLLSLGISLREEEIIKESKNLTIGRPHFARVMIKKGIVKSFSEAFDKFLGYGRPAYVSKGKASIKKVFDVIKNAGGIPVLAHPYLIGINNSYIFEKFIIFLKSIGLLGIEAIYPKHSKKISSYYCKIASNYGLIITGGSDFHDNKDFFGYKVLKKNSFFLVPYNLYKDLLEKIKI